MATYETINETTEFHAVNGKTYEIVIRELENDEGEVRYDMMVVTPDGKETDYVGMYPTRDAAVKDGQIWTEDIDCEGL